MPSDANLYVFALVRKVVGGGMRRDDGVGGAYGQRYGLLV
jgi:hypothetical protein